MIQLPIYSVGNVIDPVWNTCVNFVSPNDELPLRDNITNLYLDLETTSGSPDLKSINPHKNCEIAGIAVLFDSEKIPYYIPVQHAYIGAEDRYCYRSNQFGNYNPDKVYDWIQKILSISKNWINHNIKYDFHVIYNEIGFWPKCNLIDTLILSKLADLEERFTYSLDAMMRVIGVDITHFEAQIKACLGKDQDYGLIPPDKMAEYAAVDVLSVRLLYSKLRQMVSKDCDKVVQLEHDILPMIIGMEQTGTRISVPTIVKKFDEIRPKQVERLTKIRELSGFTGLDPSKKSTLKKLFCEVLGWELDFTPKSLEQFINGEISEGEIKYSFGYASLMKHHKKNPELVDTFIAYQEDEKLTNSFIYPYLKDHIDGQSLIKCNFNQIVRTGRLSCTNPNMNQLSEEAMEFVIPYSDDYVLVCFDLSQIEFRVIVHYINNRKCIEDYNLDPNTDFHTWVANMCGIPRKPAKNVNFMLGYGGGKGKCIAMLSELPDIVKELNNQDEINSRALAVYQSYHNALPELKPTQYRASDVLKSRGYVRTMLGRRRHIPKRFCYKAFNSVCQGTAADIFKAITRKLKKFISKDCLLHLLVHDSWTFSIKKDIVHDIVPEIKYEIEKPIEGLTLNVPIVSDFKIGANNWRECK